MLREGMKLHEEQCYAVVGCDEMGAVRGDHAAWEGRWDYWTMLPKGMLLHEGML